MTQAVFPAIGCYRLSFIPTLVTLPCRFTEIEKDGNDASGRLARVFEVERHDFDCERIHVSMVP